MNLHDEVLAQAAAMRESLLSMGGNLSVGRAQDMLNWSREEGRDASLGEVMQAAAMLLVVAERKMLECS